MILSTETPSEVQDALTDAGRRRRLTRTRVIAGAVAVCVLAGGGTAAYLATAGSQPSSAAASPMSVTEENVKVSTGTMRQTASASGTLQPAEDSDLTFAVSGPVTAVDVTTGQKVTKGQTLATVDPTALADQAAADEASLTSAQDRLTTDEDAGASTSTIDSDEAQITSATTQLGSAQTDLANATLKATFSGTVAASGLARGDSVILADPSQAVPSSSTNTFSSSTNTFSSRRLGGPPGG